MRPSIVLYRRLIRYTVAESQSESLRRIQFTLENIANAADLSVHHSSFILVNGHYWIPNQIPLRIEGDRVNAEAIEE